MNDRVKYGRKIFAIINGQAIHRSTEITEKPLPNEDERAFTARLLQAYGHHQGKMEIIFRNGRPNYAQISYSVNGQE